MQRNRKVLSSTLRYSALAALLIGILVPISSIAIPPKAGAKCTKLGTTAMHKGKMFTCLKKQSKLAWSKGSPIKLSASAIPSPNSVPTPSPIPVPTQDPTPSPTPVPSQINTPTSSPSPTTVSAYPLDMFGNPTSEEARRIDELIDAAWEKGKPATQYLKISSHERVADSKWAKDNAAIMPAITRVLDGIGAPVTRDVEWFVWWDLDSLKSKLPENCWARDTRYFDPKAVGAGYCTPSTIFVFFDAYRQWYPTEGFLEKYPNEWDKYGISAVSAGEVAHFAQQLYGERFGHRMGTFLPAWLREGPTILYNSIAYSKLTGIPYSTVRNLAIKHNGNYRCKDVNMSDLLMHGTSPTLCEYVGGFLAVEYLVAKSGNLKEPFRYLESKIDDKGRICGPPNSVCRDIYEDVIREIYSKDIDAWHTELQKYVRKWSL